VSNEARTPVVVEIVYDGADFDGFERVKAVNGSNGEQQAARFTVYDPGVDKYIPLRLPLFKRRLISELGPHIDTIAGNDSRGVKISIRIEIDPVDDQPAPPARSKPPGAHGRTCPVAKATCAAPTEGEREVVTADGLLDEAAKALCGACCEPDDYDAPLTEDGRQHDKGWNEKESERYIDCLAYPIRSLRGRFSLAGGVDDPSTVGGYNRLVAAVQAAAPSDETKEWREMLWARHGCSSALYGDDGELQCAACGIDFKRQPAVEIAARFQELGRLKLMSSPPPATPEETEALRALNEHRGSCRGACRDQRDLCTVGQQLRANLSAIRIASLEAWERSRAAEAFTGIDVLQGKGHDR